MPEPEIVLYGAAWCPDCRRSKAFLATSGSRIRYVDLEAHPEETDRPGATTTASRSSRRSCSRTGRMWPSRRTRSSPSKLGLTREAADVHVRPRDRRRRADRADDRDLRRSGEPTDARGREVGPRRAGGRDRAARQLPGLPRGDRRRRAGRPVRAAGRALRGGDAACGVGGVASTRGRRRERHTSTGQQVTTRRGAVATGSTYRRTGAEGEEDLIGAGIHFCATCDGPFYKGADELVVIGGGNSGSRRGCS